MNCPKCESKIRDQQKFCGKCGESLRLHCPKCKTENNLDDVFCIDCGADLREGKKPAEENKQSLDLKNLPNTLQQKITTLSSKKIRDKKPVTIMFADVVGYTSMSEKLTPDEVHAIINEYFRELSEVIYHYEGVVDKYIGDCIMALFGAPVNHEDDPERAILSGLSMLDIVKRKNEEHGLDLKLRIGINCGVVIAGHIGHDLKFEYTVIGDAVNTAQRVESNSQPNRIMVSQAIYDLCNHAIEFEEAGEFSLKGKAKPLTCYFAVGAKQNEKFLIRFRGHDIGKLIGRKKELDLMIASFDKVKASEGRILAICGNVGVGKTRLIFELKSIFRKDHVRFHWLMGGCLPYLRHRTYYLFEQLLRFLAGEVIIQQGQTKIATIKEKLNQFIARQGGQYQLEDAIAACTDDLSFQYIPALPKAGRWSRNSKTAWPSISTMTLCPIFSNARSLPTTVCWVEDMGKRHGSHIPNSFNQRTIYVL